MGSPVDDALDRLTDYAGWATTPKSHKDAVATVRGEIERLREAQVTHEHVVALMAAEAENRRLREERDAARKSWGAFEQAALVASAEADAIPRDPRVATFALIMERELAANARKDAHPLSGDFDHLLSELRGHVEKFAADPTDEHAADVANLAMLALAASPSDGGGAKCPDCGHDLHGYPGPRCRYCTPGEYWE